MAWNRLLLTTAVAVTAYLWCRPVLAGDLRISIPKQSRLTPVQRLNREGVEAIRKHNYEKAKGLFYKAYLFDPDDPFTLNNLGYISELDGEVERAHQFYTLASQQASGAVIDLASSRKAEGKPVTELVRGVQDKRLEVNRSNLEALRLLSNGRAAEADVVLQRTLTLDPHNPFTLNNLGVAKEMEGELDDALKYYTSAASSQSHDPAMVTTSKVWRGKPVSEMAQANAKNVRAGLENQQNIELRVARLNLRGVAALNRNQTQDADQYFRRAYSLDPANAYSLNNLGYVSELNGDPETAQGFYQRAQRANRAGTRVGLATRREAEGMPLFEVANGNNDKVEGKIAEIQAERRRQQGPIRLMRRDGTVVTQAPSTQSPTSSTPIAPAEPPQSSPALGPPQPSIPQLTPQSSQPPSKTAPQ